MKLRHFVAAWLFLGAAGAQGQILRVAINNDPDILDPTLSRTFVGTAVMSALCDKLFDFDQALAIVPRLAASYEWTDPVTLILHLRPASPSMTARRSTRRRSSSTWTATRVCRAASAGRSWGRWTGWRSRTP